MPKVVGKLSIPGGVASRGCLIAPLLALLMLCACPAGKIREEGENGGRCFEDNTCRAGLTCVSGWCLRWPEAGAGPGCKGCPDAGPVASDGGCPDARQCPAAADGAVCADAQPCPSCPDAAVVPDAKICPTCADAAPCADAASCPGACPTVKLQSPAKGAQTAKVSQQFSFKVTGSNPIADCKLLINGKVVASLNKPGPSANFTHGPIPDGTLTWDVVCTDSKGNVGYSNEARLLSSTHVMLHGCKTSGFAPDTKYKLSTDINAGTGHCFVIDAGGVQLDGNNKKVLSAKTKDIIFHRSSSQPFTVLSNKLTSSGGGFSQGWASTLKGQKNLHANAADFDDDGDLDLITAEYSGKWRIYTNTGAGSFGSSSTYAIGGGMGYDVSRVLDFDLDGNLDLFLSHDGSSEVFLRGNGSTSAFVQGFAANMGTYTHDLDLGDFNGDARVDVIAGSAAHSSASDLRFLRLNALTPGTGGSFSVGWTSSASDERGSGPSLVADFNGDDAWDLALPRNYNSTYRTHVRVNNGKGTGFSETLKVSNAVPVAALDLDGDDDTDLLLQVYVSGKPAGVLIYKNNGKASFTLHSGAGLPTSGRALAAVMDVDGDGDADLALVESGVYTKPFSVYRNDGKGTFTKVWTSAETGSFTQVQARDFDADGDQDMFAAVSQSSSNHRMLFYRNNGVGGFASAWSAASSGSMAYNISNLGDLDGPAASGILIKANNVTVKNFASLHGFTRGVDVRGDSSDVSSVTVRDPDIHAIRYSNVTSGKLVDFQVADLHQGTGLAVLASSNISVQSSRFCVAGRKPRVVNLSAYCYKASGLSGSNNRMQLINGCQGLGWKSCR